MNRAEIARRTAEGIGDGPTAVPQLKPRPPEWLIERILEACSGKPGEALAAWLGERQVFPEDIAAWREERAAAVADWSDPGKVLRSVRGILDPPHPQATFLLGMLHSLVARHAPQNAELVPLTMR